ncbi:4-hydroxybenzoate polyprenyltransferase [Malassezia cuniculi]|uniref:4-hydroxybenzoate polyprenyltransferase, mitochondrial n=1 Tax=Malassezia cuniculi TaxID=948313 RepID=A0AAF0EPN4_9BASI|nr:4-hydroxybenzoate polyprenyltransferase [Malassezia cuniculi]
MLKANGAPKPSTGLTLRPYLELARMDKPIGSWLLYMPCTWSITLASQHIGAPPSVLLTNLALFGVGSVIMRGAGCTINDMWDAPLDAKVDRTRTRPLAAGTVTYAQATGFLALQLAAGLGVLMNLNWYSIVLGACSLGPVAIYPFMKRVTYFPQVVLGLTFTWGTMLGWSAVAGSCYWPAVLPIYAGTAIWTVAYDTIYAHQDKNDDRFAGVKSTALFFGDKGTKPAISAMTAVWMPLLAYGVNNSSPIFASFSMLDGSTQSLLNWLEATLATGHPFFAVSWLVAAAHLMWQIRTVDLNNRADLWSKFTSTRTVGIIIFLGLLGDYLYQYANDTLPKDKEIDNQKA